MTITISGGYGDCKKCEETKEDILFWNSVKEGSPYVSDSIYIKTSGHKGFGVFAKKDLKKDEVIEYCHCMVLTLFGKDNTDARIRQYAYTFRDGDSLINYYNIIPFGFGAIYNTSDTKAEANARYAVYGDQKLIVFRASRNILKNEEILVWWGERYYDEWIGKKA